MLAACLTAIAEMSGADQELGQNLHGAPAYANAAGQVVVFFQAAAKFMARYATIGFQEAATLDEGSFWPTSFAVTTLDDSVTQRLVELLQKATLTRP